MRARWSPPRSGAGEVALPARRLDGAMKDGSHSPDLIDARALAIGLLPPPTRHEQHPLRRIAGLRVENLARHRRCER
jgi:hypothetical protein